MARIMDLPICYVQTEHDGSNPGRADYYRNYTVLYAASRAAYHGDQVTLGAARHALPAYSEYLRTYPCGYDATLASSSVLTLDQATSW